MNRICSGLRRPLLISSSLRLLSQSPPVAFPLIKPISRPISIAPILQNLGFRSPFPHQFQVRHFAVKDRSRAPRTPMVSKVKKYKIKGYSSFKSRFRTMHDGNIRRWRAGKRHNAHSKSKISKRRLRKPEIVHLAYAKVLKKLNFSG